MKIDGRAAPSPSEIQVTLTDGSTVERSASGSAVADFMASRRRIRIRWAHLTGAQLKNLLAAVEARFFMVAWPDPVTGEETGIECYCTGRSMGLRQMRDGLPVWTDIEMEWTER